MVSSDTKFAAVKASHSEAPKVSETWSLIISLVHMSSESATGGVGSGATLCSTAKAEAARSAVAKNVFI